MSDQVTPSQNAHLYTQRSLMGTLRSLKRPKRHLLDTVFTRVQNDTSEDIHFDVEVGARRIAPFVAPTAQGRVVERLGFNTGTFRPAYLKPKTPVLPGHALKRALGEQIGGGNYSPLEREAMIIASILADHADQIIRRQEVMAAEVLVTGGVTVSGEDYQTQHVDYGRNPDLNIEILDANARWTEAGATPIDDIEEWAELVHEIEGASIHDITMDPIAYKWFRRNKQVYEILDVRRAAGANTLELGGMDLATGAKFGGNFGTFRVWVYSEYYIDPADGIQKPLLPAGTVLGTSPDTNGIRAYGAIHDQRAGMQALEMFPKSWIEEDPSARFIMTQSAPLPVLGRPNATFSAKVL